MKIIQVILIIMLLGCCASTNSQNDKEMNMLKLRFRCQFASAVGWGEIFRCEVLEVIQGDFHDPEILISRPVVMDTTIRLEPHKIWQASFKKCEENVKYSIIPIYGMVDRHKTAWCIETIQEVKTNSKDK